MIVAGVMSGTSADGINVALVKIQDRVATTSQRSPGRHSFMTIKLLAHTEVPYTKKVRQGVMAAMNASQASVAGLSRLNFLLGELYAGAVLRTQQRFSLRAELVGCHGQTIYHQGEPVRFLGRSISATWQIGEAAVIAARVGIPVVSDFRPADMAAGGKGAPLVPYFDYLLYRDASIGRVVQNIGGIANLTAIPAGASAQELIAFDTGPGNMVMDAVMDRLYHRAYDRNGEVAASGLVRQDVISRLLEGPFFSRKPPKTAGREEFGREFVSHFLDLCSGFKKQDMVATATALTAASIARALQRFLIGKRGAYREMILSGGGTKNATLLAMLANELKPLGLDLRLTDEFGLPSEAKEAVAFAVLAYQTWHRRPSNVPSATGAGRPAVLGKISYV